MSSKLTTVILVKQSDQRSTSHPGRCRRKLAEGFTLIELLVVVSIIALLVSLLVPALQEARHAAEKVVCMSNVRSTAMGFYLYAGDNNSELPGAHTYFHGYVIRAAVSGYGDIDPAGTYLYQGKLVETGMISIDQLFCPADTGSYNGTPINEDTYKNFNPAVWLCGYLYRRTPVSGNRLNPLPHLGDEFTTSNIYSSNPAFPGPVTTRNPCLITCDATWATLNRLATKHFDGFTAGYADGTVRWIEADNDLILDIWDIPNASGTDPYAQYFSYMDWINN